MAKRVAEFTPDSQTPLDGVFVDNKFNPFRAAQLFRQG